jgi:antitoxin component YwqK of YwqJK toxin-antitoxin module
LCGSVYGEEPEVQIKYWDNGKLKSEVPYKNGEEEGYP